MALLSELDPRLVPAAQWLLDVGRYYGLSPLVTSTRRSMARQAELYQELGGHQVCPPGTSAHEHGLAFDLVVAAGKLSPQQAFLGQVWLYIGGAWSPKDPVHFAVGKVGCYGR